jgi:hypothetical protein
MKKFNNIQPQHPQQHPQRMLNGVVVLFDEEDIG